MPPELLVVERFLTRVARRVTGRAVAEGCAIGFASAIVVALFGWPRAGVARVALGVVLAGAGILIRLLMSRRARGNVALYVEHHAPTSRNIVLTAHELGTSSTKVGDVPTLVFHRAANVVRTLDAGTIAPIGQAVAALIATFGVWLLVVSRPGQAIVPATVHHVVAPTDPTIDAISVTIIPPGYTGRPAQTLNDPARISAIAGSHISILIRGNADRVAIATVASHDTLAPTTPNRFRASLTADADGFISLEPRLGAKVGTHRLVGMSVIPDVSPKVEIKAPGHDLRLPDGHRTLSLTIDANDDIGLASLTLHYTKVSGSGERFTFAEGDLPLRISRTSNQAWQAHADWKLDALALEPGDMVVYRAVAADHRPNAAPTESDAYIAEVIAPGGVAVAGFATDPEQDRYAVSQEMVIVKTERLLARRDSISHDAFVEQAQEIAIEQRKVRAEFVFMLGGELADAPDPTVGIMELNETEEAEGESDLLAGRNANAGHAALVNAIRSMSRAAASLNVGDADPALPHERAALTNLESAFSHARILLRALDTHERLDVSRRLTGNLTDALRDTRPAATSLLDADVQELRGALADIATLTTSDEANAQVASRASLDAERVLRVNPSAKALQDVAQQVSAAASALSRGRKQDANALLDRAATGLVSVLRSGLGAAPPTVRSLEDAQLAGALRDALPGGRP